MSEEKTKGENKTEDIVKYTQTEILAENIQLKATVDRLEKKLGEVTAGFDNARQQLEADTKSKKIERILRVADLNMGLLLNKSLAELDEIEELYKYVKTPTFRSTGDSGKFANEYDQTLYKLNNMFKFDKK